MNASPAGALQGRVFLVTGASRRVAIGAAISRRLVTGGASVLVHSWSAHDEEQLWGADTGGAEALVEELGVRAAHVSADLADPAARRGWSGRPASRSAGSMASWPTTPAAAARTSST